MALIWSRQLSIGNRILDSEHKNLYGIINKMACSIAARDVAALSEAFELLENCLCTYFVVEERIAQAINFDFAQHRLAHRQLLEEFQRMKGELTAEKGLRPGGDEANYAHLLTNCLMHHIKEDSRPLKMVLDTHFYDFNPEQNFFGPSHAAILPRAPAHPRPQ